MCLCSLVVSADVLEANCNPASENESRAFSHGDGGPQVGEVPRLGGVTNLSIQSLFFS